MKDRFVRLLIVIISLSTFNNLSICLGQQSEPDEIDSLRIILKSVDSDEFKYIDLHIEIAKAYRNLNIDSSIYYSSRACSLSMETGYIKGLAHGTYYKANYYNKTQDIDKSLELFLETIELYNKIEKDRIYLKTLTFVGIIYEFQHDYDRALEYYLIGLENAKNLDSKIDIGMLYNNISIIYNYTGRKESEIDFKKKASKIFYELGEEKFYSYTLQNIGLFHESNNDFDSAYSYYSRAKELFLKMNNNYGLSNVYTALGRMSRHRDNLDQALKYYQKSLTHAELIDVIEPERLYHIAIAQLNLGEIKVDIKDFNSAFAHFRSSYSLGKQLHSLNIKKRSSFGLFRCFLNFNQADSALHYHQIFLVANDSLLSETYNERIDKLDYDFQMSQEKIVMENEKQVLILKQQRKELIYLSIVGILLTLSIVSILIWLLQRNKLRNSRLRNRAMELETSNMQLEIESKNRKLASVALNLIERNEFIASISEKLKNTKLEEDQDEFLYIQNVIKEIDRSNTNKIWDEFEKRFMEVHGDFYQKLTTSFPDLTLNERKLCAFILLNMSTKDISSITYQSPHSIKIARYRLRKKLGLEKNENLNAFLHNL